MRGGEGGGVFTQAISPDLTCVASISVRFWSKERGTRVKDRAKNGANKREGRGWGRKVKNPPVSRSSLLRNPTETLATQVSYYQAGLI